MRSDGKEKIKEKIKLFEETIKQIFYIEIPTENNLLKENKNIETNYINLEK